MDVRRRGEDVTATWRDVFGYPEAYPEQADGIETAVDVAERGGFLLAEGACGTGKTMLALAAGVDRVRDPDSEYERVLVLTSVKQQLRQFEDDLARMNANLPDDWRPVSGLTLVGKADVCPYGREGTADVDPSNVYDRCEGLRERTRNLVDGEERGSSGGRMQSGDDGGATTPGALASRARKAQTGLLDSGSGGVGHLETAGEAAPYLPETPEYGDGAATTEYCPFYAAFLDDLPEDGDPVEAVPFDFDEAGHLDAEDLVARSVRHGTCPHSMMGALLPHAEVVIGNYYHAFDPTTAETFTGALLDESTFVVCDEAHMLEPRVRDLVSDGVGDATLGEAESELTRLIQPAEFDDAGKRVTGGDGGARRDDRSTSDAELVRAELADADVTLREVKRTRSLLGDLREELDRRVERHLDRTEPGWESDLAGLDDDGIPLRDPETPGEDEISAWADESGYGEGAWVRAEAVCAVVARVFDSLEGDAADEARRAAPAVGRLLAAWRRTDHVRYFREVELERTWNETARPDSWRRAYNARLTLHNCVPGDAIASRLSEFGGGVLMSATLEPLDVFRRVTGLDRLADEGRPIVERRYGLSFPDENRASFAVAVPKFTYDNRGSVEEGESNRTRRAHADAAAEVARGPGNVLVGMPNYAEAEWMAAALRSRVDKPVLLDESSDDAATEGLKAEFFAGRGKVLVTSLRGTLTEGVDYRGDRLRAAVVCGVPLVDTSSPRTRAVRTAYDREFGGVSGRNSDGQPGASASGVGFETALTVPAVRKARQAVGRVIRGPEETGVRVLLDERYARDSWDSVREYLPPGVRGEFRPVSSDMLGVGLDRFWSAADNPE